MLQRIVTALGAGLAAGILFVVPTKGLLLGTLLAVFAPLPVMIVALGFGHLTGLVAAAVGTAVVASLVDPLYAAIFAASVGLPGWFLSLVALRRPLGDVLAWVTGVAALLALGFMLLAAARYGTYQAAADKAAEQLAANLTTLMRGDLPGGYSARDYAGWMVLVMPAVMAGWGVATLAVNLWIAGRVVQISALLPQPWANVPDNLRLPKLAGVLLLASIAGCVLPMPFSVASGAVLAALAVSFVLQGLAAIHAMTRGRQSRPAILGTTYVLSVALMPWPLVLIGLLGIADCFATLPRRPQPAQPRSTTQGDKTWK